MVAMGGTDQVVLPGTQCLRRVEENKGSTFCERKKWMFVKGKKKGVNRHTVWTHAPMRRIVDMTRQDVPTLHSRAQGRAHVEGPS